MIQFKISAPSKLSLFGEHAVKQKKRALTACVDLRTTLTFRELPVLSSGIFMMNFPQINLYYNMPTDMFLKFYSDCTKSTDSLRERVQRFTDCSYESETHRIMVQSLCYLLVLMMSNECINVASFAIHLSTDFVVDEKFLFTSYVVCLAACLLHWSRLQKGGHPGTFDDADLKTIQSYVARCRELAHELEVIDVITCMSGSITEYDPENGPSPSRPLLSTAQMPLITVLLVDSKQPQNPEVQLQQMTELMNILPETGTSIFNSIDLITRRAYNVFHQIREIHLDLKDSAEWRHDCILNQYNIIKVSPVEELSRCPINCKGGGGGEERCPPSHF